MREGSSIHECLRCGRKITREESENHNGMCHDCSEIEIDKLDSEEEDY